MKQIFLSLALFALCCSCSGGFKSAPSAPNTQTSTAPAALSVATAALPEAVKNLEYSADLAAQGGTPPYTWSVAAGQLPAGITLSSAGVLSGIPSTTGDFNITVQVTDSAASPAVARARTRVQKH